MSNTSSETYSDDDSVIDPAEHSTSAIKLNWDNSLNMTAAMVLLLGLGFSVVVALIAPFAFLGMSGVLGVILSMLFVLELTIAISALLHGLTTEGQRTLTKGLAYGFGHFTHPKLFLFIAGALLLGILLIAMGPGGHLAIAAIPLFTAGTVGGSVVLVIAAAAFYVCATLVVERVIALLVTWRVNRFRLSVDTFDMLPQEYLQSLALKTDSSCLAITKLLGIDVLAEVVGESREQVVAGLLDGGLKSRLGPAVLKSMLTTDEVVGDNGVQVTAGQS